MSKTSTKVRSGGINDKGWSIIFVATAVVLFALSSWAWWHFVRSNPERTFYSSLENSLSTRGFSRHVEQSAGAQKLDQRVQLNLTGNHLAHAATDITQEGEVNATVKTETISTPSEEYVRYTEISTDEKNKKGETIDFANLLNIWGKSQTDQSQSTGELYGESILGVVPVGNLNAQARQALMNNIRENKVYEFDEGAVERTIENGRPVYVYDVSVAPEQYVSMLKDFASAIGMTALEGVDPASYKDTQPLKFTVKVDVWSQNFVGIEYSTGARVETLGSYGLTQQVDLPKETIPVEELQSKLQEVQTQ
jgi:hypothetical protein